MRKIPADPVPAPIVGMIPAGLDPAPAVGKVPAGLDPAPAAGMIPAGLDPVLGKVPTDLDLAAQAPPMSPPPSCRVHTPTAVLSALSPVRLRPPGCSPGLQPSPHPRTRRCSPDPPGPWFPQDREPAPGQELGPAPPALRLPRCSYRSPSRQDDSRAPAFLFQYSQIWSWLLPWED